MASTGEVATTLGQPRVPEARAPLEGGQLAEEVARREVAQVPAVVVGLRGAVGEHVEVPGRLPFAYDLLAGPR